MNPARWRHFGATFVLALLVFSGEVRADVLFFDSQGDFSQTRNQLGIGTENVVFNKATAVLGPATTVTGVTNQSEFLVDIINRDMPQQNLTGSGGIGAAEVNESDGNKNFFSFEIEPNDFDSFRALGFALLFNDPDKNDEVTLKVNWINESLMTSGTSSQNFKLGPGQGNRFFGVITHNGQRGTSVEVTTNSAMGIEAIRQIEVGSRGSDDDGGAGPGEVVPEPASLLVWGSMGLVGLGGWYRRRKNNSH